VPVIGKYKSRLILRPQEMSNHPEVVRRLGLICINTALECDIRTLTEFNRHRRMARPAKTRSTVALKATSIFH
jgi:hypothetical protein